MPRGGKRTGAGRPRKSAIARKTLEKVLQDDSSITYGWNGDNLVTVAASGEYARFMREQLFQRLGITPEMETCMVAMELTMTDSDVAATLHLMPDRSPKQVH